MIEDSTIRATYSFMSDEELIEFTEKEGESLTSLAFEILKQEFQKRELDLDPITELEHKIILRYSLGIKKFEEEFSKDLFKKAWDLTFEMKLNGSSNYDVFSRLQELGIANEYAFYMVNSLRSRTQDILKEVESEITAAIVIIILGVILIYIAFSIKYFYAFAILVEGGGWIRLITSIIRKDKFRKLLTKLTEELGDAAK